MISFGITIIDHCLITINHRSVPQNLIDLDLNQSLILLPWILGSVNVERAVAIACWPFQEQIFIQAPGFVDYQIGACAKGRPPTRKLKDILVGRNMLVQLLVHLCKSKGLLLRIIDPLSGLIALPGQVRESSDYQPGHRFHDCQGVCYAVALLVECLYRKVLFCALIQQVVFHRLFLEQLRKLFDILHRFWLQFRWREIQVFQLFQGLCQVFSIQTPLFPNFLLFLDVEILLFADVLNELMDESPTEQLRFLLLIAILLHLMGLLNFLHESPLTLIQPHILPPIEKCLLLKRDILQNLIIDIFDLHTETQEFLGNLSPFGRNSINYVTPANMHALFVGFEKAMAPFLSADERIRNAAICAADHVSLMPGNTAFSWGWQAYRQFAEICFLVGIFLHELVYNQYLLGKGMLEQSTFRLDAHWIGLKESQKSKMANLECKSFPNPILHITQSLHGFLDILFVQKVHRVNVLRAC